MTCTEIQSEKYQTRKSPAFHAKDCKNLTKKGKDGDYISKADSRGVYKWVKTRGTRKVKKGTKSYRIHDNGSFPYKVDVSGKNVEIYKGEYRTLENGNTNYDTMNYDTLIKKLTVKDVYIGKSDCIPAADGCGAAFLGNTILLHVSGNKYIHVGRAIYQFIIDDEFDAYYSLVGNNDVPYPILLGTKNVYFILDFSYYPRELFKGKMTSAEWADAYSYYYGYKDFDTCERVECETQKCRKATDKKRKDISKTYEKKMKGFVHLF
jgi:hypothetical protein